MLQATNPADAMATIRNNTTLIRWYMFAWWPPLFLLFVAGVVCFTSLIQQKESTWFPLLFSALFLIFLGLALAAGIVHLCRKHWVRGFTVILGSALTSLSLFVSMCLFILSQI